MRLPVGTDLNISKGLRLGVLERLTRYLDTYSVRYTFLMSAAAADEFIRRIQSAFRLQARGNGAPIEPSHDRRDLFDNLQTIYGIGPTLQDHFKPQEGMLGEVGARIVAALPSPPPVAVSFGITEAREINARMYLDKGGTAAAICINAAVPLLLNKLIKLRVAYDDPRRVIHYNRGTTRGMTAKHYANLALSVLVEYFESREVRGPYIELDHSALGLCGAALMAAETYLLGHEVAHLGMSFGCFGMSERELLDLGEGVCESRAREIAADVLGANLARKALLSEREDISYGVPLGARTLSTLLASAGSPSPHYAPPAMRLEIILRTWFDDDASPFITEDHPLAWLEQGKS
jgi:hypothetical protein